MTLITYPSRVHFADAVLEEALHSELEGAGLCAPLLLGEDPVEASETFERIRTGLPKGRVALAWGAPAGADLDVASRTVAETMQGRGIDVVIAFGSARAIDLGRIVRRLMSLAAGTRLPFYAVPGIDGLPDPGRNMVETWRTSLPSVLICDPTLTLESGVEAGLRSAVMSLVRSTEAYLAEAYNPPADGMAMDAFRRATAILSGIGSARGDIGLHRDLMAAALNAGLSQDKGVGPTQMLVAALREACDGIDVATAARLILPGAIGAMALDRARSDTLGRLMGESALSAATLRALFDRRPGQGRVARLSEMGLGRDGLEDTIALAERRRVLPEGASRRVLEAVF